jgi:uracil-DNA glycosylase
MNINIDNKWNLILNQEFDKEYFKTLNKFIDDEYSNESILIFPPYNQIFRAFSLCKFDNLKIVILGQDPYPTFGHANGLCFSLNPDVKPFAKSLINIFKEIEIDLGSSMPENGDLTRWAEQGILLLNSILTVRESLPQSHQNIGWEKFTDAVIKKISDICDGIVFMLWGSNAQKKSIYIDKNKHFILQSGHPSPLSANRGFWFGNKHFSKANEFLKSKGKEIIKW